MAPPALLGSPARGRKRYECVDCLARVTPDEPLAACPDCGSDVVNLAVARE